MNEKHPQVKSEIDFQSNFCLLTKRPLLGVSLNAFSLIFISTQKEEYSYLNMMKPLPATPPSLEIETQTLKKDDG